MLYCTSGRTLAATAIIVMTPPDAPSDATIGIPTSRRTIVETYADRTIPAVTEAGKAQRGSAGRPRRTPPPF